MGEEGCAEQSLPQLSLEDLASAVSFDGFYKKSSQTCCWTLFSSRPAQGEPQPSSSRSPGALEVES